MAGRWDPTKDLVQWTKQCRRLMCTHAPAHRESERERYTTLPIRSQLEVGEAAWQTPASRKSTGLVATLVLSYKPQISGRAELHTQFAK